MTTASELKAQPAKGPTLPTGPAERPADPGPAEQQQHPALGKQFQDGGEQLCQREAWRINQLDITHTD